MGRRRLRVRVLGEPRGRPQVVRALQEAQRGVAMEVNGSPGRLDLPVPPVRQALDAGCRLALGSDGHPAREMLALAKARRVAREAGATRADSWTSASCPRRAHTPNG